jgi:hypothetical protein
VHLLNGLAVVVVAGAFGCGATRAQQRGDSPGVAEESMGVESGQAESVPEAEAAPVAASAPAAAPAPRAATRASRAPRLVPARSGQVVAATGSSAPAVAAAERGPMLIYTANLTMAIFEVGPALKSIEALARELGGYMASQSMQAITVRIPVERFHDAMARLEKMGDIIHREVQAEDISQEFVDLEVRLKSARAVRDRLEQLLARATRVDESIAIERELERVVGEIERLEGRLKYLRDRASFSTIAVRFSTTPKEVVAKGTFKLPFPWLDQLGLARLLNLRVKQ